MLNQWGSILLTCSSLAIGVSLAFRYWVASSEHIPSNTSFLQAQHIAPLFPTEGPSVETLARTKWVLCNGLTSLSWMQLYLLLAAIHLALFFFRSTFLMHRCIVASRSIYDLLFYRLIFGTSEWACWLQVIHDKHAEYLSLVSSMVERHPCRSYSWASEQRCWGCGPGNSLHADTKCQCESSQKI